MTDATLEKLIDTFEECIAGVTFAPHTTLTRKEWREKKDNARKSLREYLSERTSDTRGLQAFQRGDEHGRREGLREAIAFLREHGVYAGADLLREHSEALILGRASMKEHPDK